jgi:hypothetical protein
MSWFSELFNPGHGYKQAEDISKQGYDEAQQNLQPYNENGKNAGKSLYEQLMNYMNPEELQNKWAEGYKTSPYAQQQLAQNMDYGQSAAQQMGLGGSSAALANIQNTGSNIMNKDRQQYMDDLQHKYEQGTGIGENMYGTGASTANQTGQNSINQATTQAGLKFGQTNAGPELLGKMGKGALSLLMQYLTGGMGGMSDTGEQTGSFGRGMFTPNSGYKPGAY